MGLIRKALNVIPWFREESELERVIRVLKDEDSWDEDLRQQYTLLATRLKVDPRTLLHSKTEEFDKWAAKNAWRPITSRWTFDSRLYCHVAERVWTTAAKLQLRIQLISSKFPFLTENQLNNSNSYEKSKEVIPYPYIAAVYLHQYRAHEEMFSKVHALRKPLTAALGGSYHIALVDVEDGWGSLCCNPNRIAEEQLSDEEADEDYA